MLDLFAKMSTCFRRPYFHGYFTMLKMLSDEGSVKDYTFQNVSKNLEMPEKKKVSEWE